MDTYPAIAARGLIGGDAPAVPDQLTDRPQTPAIVAVFDRKLA